jgi:PPOX class probable F420-dependent enzyme
MSRRDQIRMTPEEVDEFLQGAHPMTMATISPDGRPHLVAMWYGFLDGAPALWSYRSAQKIVNLRRDPRITVMVETGKSYDTLKGVELVGTAELIEDPDRVMAVGRSIFSRYTGLPEDDTAPLDKIGAKRVAVRINVEKVVSWDHSKLGGAY